MVLFEGRDQSITDKRYRFTYLLIYIANTKTLGAVLCQITWYSWFRSGLVKQLIERLVTILVFWSCSKDIPVCWMRTVHIIYNAGRTAGLYFCHFHGKPHISWNVVGISTVNTQKKYTLYNIFKHKKIAQRFKMNSIFIFLSLNF